MTKINVDNNEMYKKLSTIQIPDDCYLLVHAESGRERKFIHYCCNQLGYQSLSIICDFFEENHIWKCKLCQKKFYTNEIYKEQDYSFITLEPCGMIYKCPECVYRVYTNRYDREDRESSGLTRTRCFNCVCVGRDLSRVNIYSRKQPKKPYNDCIDNISVKKIKVVSHDEFMDRMKIYSRKM